MINLGTITKGVMHLRRKTCIICKPPRSLNSSTYAAIPGKCKQCYKPQKSSDETNEAFRTLSALLHLLPAPLAYGKRSATLRDASASQRTIRKKLKTRTVLIHCAPRGTSSRESRTGYLRQHSYFPNTLLSTTFLKLVTHKKPTTCLVVVNFSNQLR